MFRKINVLQRVISEVEEIPANASTVALRCGAGPLLPDLLSLEKIEPQVSRDRCIPALLKRPNLEAGREGIMSLCA